MMQIVLNGELHTLSSLDTVAHLVGSLDLGNQAIAIAVNRQIVPRSHWADRVLHPQDKVDVVRAIGGG